LAVREAVTWKTNEAIILEWFGINTINNKHILTGA